MGYSQGGQLKKMINESGEDGIFFGRSGEEVLSLDKLDIADRMVSNLIDFAKYAPKTKAVSSTSNVTHAEVNLNLELNNVKDPESLLKEIQTNPKIQKALADVTIGKAMGKGSLKVNRIK